MVSAAPGQCYYFELNDGGSYAASNPEDWSLMDAAIEALTGAVKNLGDDHD